MLSYTFVYEHFAKRYLKKLGWPFLSVLPCFYLSVFLIVSNQSQPKYSHTSLVLPLFMFIMYVIARLAITKGCARNSPCFNTFLIYSFVIAFFIYASFWLCIFLVVTAHKFDKRCLIKFIRICLSSLGFASFCLLSLLFAITLFAVTKFRMHFTFVLITLSLLSLLF